MGSTWLEGRATAGEQLERQPGDKTAGQSRKSALFLLALLDVQKAENAKADLKLIIAMRRVLLDGGAINPVAILTPGMIRGRNLRGFGLVEMAVNVF